MSIFKHSYCGLITGGLGTPACCGMITMGFGVFACRIEIFHPPQPSWGGGTPVSGFYVPLTKPITTHTRMVLVTVRYKDKTWRRSYVVDRVKAAIVVKTVGLITAIKRHIDVGVSAIHKTSQKVSAFFRK